MNDKTDLPLKICLRNICFAAIVFYMIVALEFLTVDMLDFTMTSAWCRTDSCADCDRCVGHTCMFVVFMDTWSKLMYVPKDDLLPAVMHHSMHACFNKVYMQQ